MRWAVRRLWAFSTTLGDVYLGSISGTLLLVLSVVLFVVKAFALVDAATRSAADIELRSALNKQAWLLILALALLAHLLLNPWNPFGLLNLAGTLAAFVYLAQVRGSS